MFYSISSASDLVAEDNNGYLDVFVRDLVSGTTQLISTTGGGSGNARRFAHSNQRGWPLSRVRAHASNLLAGDYATLRRWISFRIQ